jgi:uncharacterized protein (TIGR02246 family)
MNKNDAVAVAAFFTEDAVLVNDSGPVYGRKAIEKSFVDFFQGWRVNDHVTKRDQYSPHIIETSGDTAWSNGEWSLDPSRQDRRSYTTQGLLVIS